VFPLLNLSHGKPSSVAQGNITGPFGEIVANTAFPTGVKQVSAS
jgi:hypothetical protein